jgi:hypothetical protein
MSINRTGSSKLEMEVIKRTKIIVTYSIDLSKLSQTIDWSGAALTLSQ